MSVVQMLVLQLNKKQKKLRSQQYLNGQNQSLTQQKIRIANRQPNQTTENHPEIVKAQGGQVIGQGHAQSTENPPENTEVDHDPKVVVTDIPPKTDTGTGDARAEIEREARVKKRNEARVERRKRKKRKRTVKDGAKVENENVAKVKTGSEAGVAVKEERGGKVKRKGREAGVKIKNESDETEVQTERDGVRAGIGNGDIVGVGVEAGRGYEVEVRCMGRR